MIKKIFLTLLFIIFLSGNAYAAPSVTSTTGVWGHDNSIVIAGTGFGSKSTAAPLVWDDCDHGDALTDRWSGGYPNASSEASYDIDYIAEYRGITLPHSNITKYLAGCHGENTSATAGYNVMVWKTATVSLPGYVYMSWYQRTDDNWDFGLSDPDDDNYKCTDYSAGSAPYASQDNWFLAYSTRTLTSTTATPRWKMTDNCGGCLDIPDQNAHGAYWELGTNPMAGAWIKVEMEIYQVDGSTGYVKLWDNGVLKVDYLGSTDGLTGTTRSYSIGGYARSRPSANNWRYFADLYVDTTLSRVIIGNNAVLANCTVREIQIPSAWSTTSITIANNLGTITAPTNGNYYLFVVDSSGDASPGYQITGKSAALTGTLADGATEAQVVAGGANVVLEITLTGDTWHADIGSDNAQTDALIAGITSAGGETYGWNNVVKANLVFGDITRNSSVLVTIAFGAEATYNPTTNETVTATISATCLAGDDAIVASPTFEITATSDPAAALTGTLVDNATEAQIVTGGETIIITLTNDTWVAAGPTFDGQRQAIIDGMDSAQSEATGWDAEIKGKEVVTAVARTNDRVCTITLSAAAAFDISANESITITVPAAALVTSGSPVVATPQFAIIFFETSSEKTVGITMQ